MPLQLVCVCPAVHNIIDTACQTELISSVTFVMTRV